MYDAHESSTKKLFIWYVLINLNWENCIDLLLGFESSFVWSGSMTKIILRGF